MATNKELVAQANTAIDQAIVSLGQAKTALAGVQDVPVTPVPPQPATGLPKYGWSTGAIAYSWSDAELAWVMQQLKAVAGTKRNAVRVDFGGMSGASRLCDAILAANQIPYVVSYGTTGPRAVDGQMAQLATKYKGKGVIFTGPNEPDLHGWTPNGLADFQVALFDSIKSADPNAIIGAPAMWKGGPGLPAFATAFAQRAKGKFMFFPFHGYDDPTQRATWNVWDQVLLIPGSPVPGASTVKGIFQANGITVPYVSDECGSKGSGDAQWQNIKKQMDMVTSGKCDGVFTFSPLVDYDSGWQNWEANHTPHSSVASITAYLKAV